MDVEAEIRDLKRRVGELEGSFGFLTGQVRDVHRALLTFQAETRNEFKKMTTDVNGRFDRVEKEVRDLRRDMPSIVAHAMRETQRARPVKPRRPS